MARVPGKRDTGQIKLPRVDAAMNKIAPAMPRGGGRGDSDKDRPLGQENENTKAARHKKIIERAMKRFDREAQASSENRKDSLDDRKMWKGDQWDSGILAQRQIDKRPALTVNKLQTFTRQVTNDLRQNRPSIVISPVGDRGDVEAAKMYRGLIRSIERDSVADIAYDTGADDAVRSGFGYWRIVVEYERPDSFDQVIRTKRIRNPFTVYLDNTHQEPDGSDAQWGFITEMIPRDEFEEDHPDCDPMPWTNAGIGEAMKNWMSKDEIRVAEYFEIEQKKRSLVRLDTGHEGWKDELDEATLELIDKGEIAIEETRDSHVPVVMWYKLTAKDVISERKWLGKYIPIVKVIGDEIDIEGKVSYQGVVRQAKGAQQMYNYWRTKETEAIALSPNAPWVMEEGQVEGHTAQWKMANIRSVPYLLYKATSISGRPAPAPQRQPFAGIPAGIIQAVEGAAQDMIATTGIRFDATKNERMIDESGAAIRELRHSGDLGSFHYTDNMARSLRHTGEIYLDLIPKVYNRARVVTILRDDDTEEQVRVDPTHGQAMGQQRMPAPAQAGPGGMMVGGGQPGAGQPGGSKAQAKVMKIFNPTIGRYGVTVLIGPSFATKRTEASANMIAFARALPQTASLFADLIAKNQDWPGAEVIAARIAKTLPPNLLTPDDADMSPQIQALLQNMDGQIKQLTQQLQAAMHALQDKSEDRKVDMLKIEHDFEAKVMAIVAGMETKFAAVQEKAVSNFNTHIGSQMSQLGEHVTGLIHAVEGASAGSANGKQPGASQAGEGD